MNNLFTIMKTVKILERVKDAQNKLMIVASITATILTAIGCAIFNN